MKRVMLVAWLIVVGPIGIVFGQSQHADSILDRIVPEQPGGGPYALNPALSNWSDGSALAVGRAAGIVVGFEAAPEVTEVGAVATKELAALLKIRAERGQRVSLAGKTVREALDTIVAVDPRYRWMNVQGVPVVRPWASWTDPRNPLNQVVAPVVWPETDLATALSDVVALITRTNTSGPVPGAGRGPKFAVQTGPIAVMELLNTIATAHGAVRWYMRHHCSPVDPRAVYLHIEAVDENQPHGLGSCRRTSDAANPER